MVDAAGHVVAPGFIDIQSHSIIPLMRDGRCLSKITQGVTTEIMGEGWTPAPFGGLIPEPREHDLIGQDLGEWRERMRGWRRFGDWLDAFVERGVSPNVGSFLGGGTLRQYAKGMAIGAANARRTRRHAARHGRGDGGRRLRRFLCADLPARRLRRHR